MAFLGVCVTCLQVLCLTVLCGSYARQWTTVMDGDISYIYTNDTYGYSQVQLEITEQNFLVFSVKACSDAGLALASSRHNITANNMMEVKLGGWENTRSIIRTGPGTPEIASVDTPGILHCGESRTFWIHWGYSHVTVGRGSRMNEQTFMYAPRVAPYDFSVYVIAFSTGFSHTGVWEVEENQAYYLRLFTPNTSPESFQYLTKSVQYAVGFLTFKVRACNDVFVALGENRYQQLYRVNFCAFGANDHMCVWFNGVENCTAVGVNYCSCEHHQQFWVGFRDGEISMGLGGLYRANQLHAWAPPVWKTITYASFATGWGAQGDWIFEEDKENSFGIFSNPDSDAFNTYYNTWVLTAKHHYVPFTVQTCQDAYLAISSQPGLDNEMYSYHVYLGKNNQVSGVSQDFTVGSLYEVQTPNLLHCNQSVQFWMSFYGGRLRLGRGIHYGYNVIIDFAIDTEYDMQSVGFASPVQNAYWVIRKNHGDQFMTSTPPTYHWRTFWMTTRQDYVTYVRVKGVKDAIVLLTEVPGYFDKYPMEVVIGYATTQTIIRQRTASGYVTWSTADTPGILSKDEYRTFWIGWINSILSVGQGWKYGERRILETTEKIPHTVNGLAVSSYDQVLAWEFEADQGDCFVMKTPNNSPMLNWVRLYSGDADEYHTWIYFQMSGGAAQLCISSVYRDMSNGYFINIGAEHNTVVQLYRGKTLLTTVTTTDRPVMSPDEMNDYWISWTNGLLEFGRSRYRGSQTILQYNTGGDLNAVTGIALSGFDGHSAYWRFFESQGLEEASHESMSSDTGSTTLWVSVNQREDLRISVTACNSTYITLSTIMHSTSPGNSYQIVLVDPNTGFSSIWSPYQDYKSSFYQKEVEINARNLLSCDQERFLWLSWKDGYIAVGVGQEHGVNHLMSFYHFNSLPIRAILFETRGVKGVFRVSSYGTFAPVSPDVEPTLSIGAWVGLGIGYIALLGLFVGAVIVIFRPPKKLQLYFMSPPSPDKNTTGTEPVSENIVRESARKDESNNGKRQSGFQNPAYGGDADGAHLGFDQEL